MAVSKHEPRLRDIVNAITRVRTEAEGMTLEAFEADWRKQWLVERGIEIISEASRHLPAAMKARHPNIPWQRIAGIGNILRHDYESIAAEILWRVSLDELEPLEAVCREELEGRPPTDS